jgi:hypothetical protein
MNSFEREPITNAYSTIAPGIAIADSAIAMQIRFISTLTADDEERLAETIVETAKAMLGTFPIGYMLRVETTAMRVFEHNRVHQTDAAAEQPLRARMAKKSL